MSELIGQNWWLIAIALVLGLAVAWWIFVAGRRTKVEIDRRDTLDEGADKARRNQALIDAPKKAEEILAAPPAREPEPTPVTPKKPATNRPAPRKPKPVRQTVKKAVAPPPARELDRMPPPTPEGLAGVGAVVQAEAATAPAPHHDLTQLKGVGPKLVVMLHQLGVTGFDDIAGWSDADIDRIDPQLEQFAGRIRRDNWVAQARLLAAGDIAGFESKFGKL